MSHLYKQKSMFWLAFSVRGKLHRESLKTKDKATARYLQAKHDQLLAEGKYAFISSNALASDILAQYELEVATRRSKPTHSQDISRVRKFLEWARPGKISNITDKHLQDYINYRMNNDSPAERKIGNQTANHLIIQVGAFLKYAVKRGYLQSNPTAEFKNFKISVNPPRFLSSKEIKEVLSKAKKEILYPAVATAIYTGMRRGEIINLDWQDIDWARNTITIRNKEDFAVKSRRFRVIPLHPALKAILQPYRHREGRCFDTVNWRRVLNRILRQAKVKHPGEGWHLLRHSFASNLVINGVDIATISKLLGHSNLSTTEIYLHLRPEHLQQSIERLDF